MLQKFDPKNANIFIHVSGRLLRLQPREEAKVSVFDSAFHGSIALWEGLCLYKNGIFSHRHLYKRFVYTLAFTQTPLIQQVRKATAKAFQAIGRADNTCIQLILSPKEKIASGVDSHLNKQRTSLITGVEVESRICNNGAGLCIITSWQHSNSSVCFHDIIRGETLESYYELNIPVEQQNLLLAFYNTDEVLTSSAIEELTLADEISRRKTRNRYRFIKRITTKLQYYLKTITLNYSETQLNNLKLQTT